METIGVKQARTFLAVAEHQSVTKAARAINRSQTSVTKSIQELEKALGVELFDRSTKGVTLNAYGDCLSKGAKQAQRIFREAQQLVPPAIINESPGVARFFEMDVSDKWLDAFLATAEVHNVPSAARQLGVSTAAVSALLRKLEDTLHTSLFERTPIATVPTSFARSLTNHIKLARKELRHACDELQSMQGEQRGRVVVGSLPFMRTRILPHAIAELRSEFPLVDIATMEGPYEDLVTALRCGDIDMILGALRETGEQEELAEEMLLEEELSIIVSSKNALAKKSRVSWKALMKYQWILPPCNTPTRKLFEDLLASRALPAPEHVVESSSLVVVRGLLMETDYITILSRHQIHYDELSGQLTALPIELPETRRPIGITTRANSSLSPAAKLMANYLRDATQHLS
ncbi:MAG: LysR family transcriptional regulator [Pseudomonadota bacterium]